MSLRLEVTPRGRLALLLLHLAAGAAWLSGDDNARLAAAMIAAPILVDLGAKLLGRPRLRIQLGPRRTIARTAFLETVTVHNEGPGARELLLREPRTQVLDAGGAHLPWLEPGGARTLRIAARSPRRGRAASRQFSASTAWPLGMFRWTIDLSLGAELLTEPTRAPLPAEILRALAATEQAERPGSRSAATEFWALREYRDGEDARLVHARRSAAVGDLVRKVHRGADDRNCTLVVDLRRPPGMPPTFGRRELELHLSRAAALVDALRDRGIGFRALVIGEATAGFTVAAGGDGRALLAELAVARTVAFRALDEDELAGIDAADACFWLAAGGYDEGVPHGRPNLRAIGRAS
jgi:uncharacterized protein (DUF58 family)